MIPQFLAVLLFALSAAAQEKEKSVAQLEAEKRDPKLRAAALLDSAVQNLAAAKPESQAAALATIGQHYHVIDRKKAIEFLRQAWTATAALADHPSSWARSQAQADVISTMSTLDAGEAIALLRQMEPAAKGLDRRTQAAGQIIDGLIKKKDLETALSVVDSLSGSGSFPYRPAQRLFKALPAEDARRLGLFAAATSAYAAKQDNSFGDMLAGCWDDLPASMAQASLDVFVKQILGLKDDGQFQSTTMSGEKGAVHFDRTGDLELFKVFHLIQRVDPKRAAELLESRPAIRSAMAQFPEGFPSMKVQSTNTNRGGSKPPPDQQGRMQLAALSESRAAAALAALSKDPQHALSLASDVPLPEMRAQVLGAIARSAAAKDPVTANAALGKCIALLDEVKDPGQRIEAWVSVADAAHQVKDDQLAAKALERLLSDAALLLKADTSEDAPNIALRDLWPSTQAYRKAMIAAAKNLGVDAEPMLDQIKDPDMHLFARIELAAALLGRERQNWSVSISRVKR